LLSVVDSGNLLHSIPKKALLLDFLGLQKPGKAEKVIFMHRYVLFTSNVCKVSLNFIPIGPKLGEKFSRKALHVLIPIRSALRISSFLGPISTTFMLHSS